MTAARILVVDDEVLLVDELVRLLTHHGYRAEGSTQPLKVGTLAKNANFDLVLVDINMPEHSGIRVLLDLAVSSPGSRVVMMSAASDVNSILDCIRHGAVDFIASRSVLKIYSIGSQ